MFKAILKYHLKSTKSTIEYTADNSIEKFL